MNETRLILYNIRSAHNVGSIFRTADAAGVSKIYLCGLTPTPVDRFGRTRDDIEKVALGAEKSVAWEYVPDILPLVALLKGEGVHVIAVEQASAAVSYRQFRASRSSAFVLGNEVEGIPKEILDLADAIVEIPMLGKKESLNVAVTAGIILFIVRDFE